MSRETGTPPEARADYNTIEIPEIGQVNEKLAALAWENFLKRIGNNSEEKYEREVLLDDLRRFATLPTMENKNIYLAGDAPTSCQELIHYLKDDFDPINAVLVTHKIIKAPGPNRYERSIESERQLASNKLEIETKKIHTRWSHVNNNLVELKNATAKLKKQIKPLDRDQRSQWKEIIDQYHKQADDLKKSTDEFNHYFYDQKMYYQSRLMKDTDLKQTISFYESWMAEIKKTLSNHEEQAAKLAENLATAERKLQVILMDSKII